MSTNSHVIDVVEPLNGNGRFFCGACKTWFETDGAAPATHDQLLVELQEHRDELHA